MIVHFAVALTIICCGWILSIPLLFIAGVVLIALVLVYQQLEVSESKLELSNLKSLLQKRGYRDRSLTAVQQLNALIWELDSYRDSSEESSLSPELIEITQELAKKGPTALRTLPAILLSKLRAKYIAVCYEKPKGGVVQFQSSLKPIDLKVVKTLLQGEERGEKESRFSLISLQDGSLMGKFPVEKNLGSLLVLRNSNLYLIVGYRKKQEPIHYEKRMLKELFEKLQRGLKEREKERKQEQYVAHISHDIRTPLNNIQAILDLFFLEGLNDENKKFLEVARNNCGSLRDIVEDLLEFTKYQEGKLSTRPELLSPTRIAEEVVSDFELRAEEKKIALSLSGDTHYGIHVDRKHFKRILLNLVSNALKYTERGDIKVLIDETSESLIVRVSDTGIGIPQDRIATLFTPFSRLGEVEVEGVGLGLTLTKILIEINGGEVSCESVHGKGSTFSVSFPKAKAVKAPMPKNTPENSLSPSEVCLNEKILIYDDCVDSGRTLAKLLAHHGYEVKSATKIADIENIINFWKPDVLISDVHTPDGGIDAALTVAEKHGLPIVVVTGSSDGDTLQKLRDLNLTKVLQKPVEPEELLQYLA